MSAKKHFSEQETAIDGLARAYARADYYIVYDTSAQIGSGKDFRHFWRIRRDDEVTTARLCYVSRGTVIEVATGRSERSLKDQYNKQLGRLIAKGRAIEAARFRLNDIIETRSDLAQIYIRGGRSDEVIRATNKYVDARKAQTDSGDGGVLARVKAAAMGVVDEILEALKR